MYVQIAKALQDTVGIETPGTSMTDRHGLKIRRIVAKAEAAFRDPSTWTVFREFGPFMDGAAAPEKLNSVLREFHPLGESLFDMLEEAGWDKGVLARSLSDLVDTRHAAAHALSDRTPPSPNDAMTWALLTFRLARAAEMYLAAVTNDDV